MRPRRLLLLWRSFLNDSTLRFSRHGGGRHYYSFQHGRVVMSTTTSSIPQNFMVPTTTRPRPRPSSLQRAPEDPSSSIRTSSIVTTTASNSGTAPPPTIIDILGAGSIGLLLAAMIRLSYPSYPVRLLLRPTSLLLLSSSSSTSSTSSSSSSSSNHHHKHKKPKNNNSNRILMISLQTTFPVSTTTCNTLHQRRRRPPRMVPVPYAVIRPQHHCPDTTTTTTTTISTGPVLPSSSLSSSSFRPKQKSPRCILVTTKAYQAVAAIQSYHLSLLSSSWNNNDNDDDNPILLVVVCCNGALAVVDELQQLQLQQHDETARNHSSPPPPRRRPIMYDYYYGIVTHGAYREPHVTATEATMENEDVGHVVHAGNGRITILPTTWDDRTTNDHNYSDNDNPSRYHSVMQDVVQVLDTSGLHCDFLSTEPQLLLLWKKLAANCVINPLTVIYHCHNGALLNDDEAKDERTEVVVPNFTTRYLIPICDEIAQVYLAVVLAATDTTSGRSTPTHDDDDDELRERISTLFRDYVRQVIRDTATNRSSTYQDVYQHQHQHHDRPPRTEMDYFNGYILRKAQQYQLECPVNQQVVQEFNDRIHRHYNNIHL